MIIEARGARDITSRSEAIRELIARHGIVSFPTDTVSGIGCSIYDDIAVRRIIAMKDRDASKGLAVLVSNLNFATRLASFSGPALALANGFWPGPLTLLLPLRKREVSSLVAYGNRIALRIPASEIARALAEEFGGAMVGTSINRTGEKPMSDVREVTRAFPDIGIAITSSAEQSGTSSTVYDVESGRVLREGSIREADIRAAVSGWEAAPTRRFSRNVEDFECAHCHAIVKGTGYTNHCPSCLWSMHVDNNPGDRASKCHGMMNPVRAEYSRDGFTIVHRCERCGAEKRCKAGPTDSQEILESLAGRH